MKSEAVYRAIKSRIVSAVYSSGYRLVVADLAQEFSVSGLPVRDAIGRLEREGMVSIRKNVGAQVVGVDLKKVRDELSTVAYLEGLAASLAFREKSDEDLARAEAINSEMIDALDKGEHRRLNELNQRFHEALCIPCPNHRLEVLLKEEWEWSTVLMESAYELLPDVARTGVEEHRDLIALLRSSPDPRDLEFAVRMHRMGNVDVFDALLKRSK
ncbi:GntR family transcriptional regulator [Paenarthrobacter nicotinovorans]|uniref:GntR family transcriptional regulator n=1 Tax=Paenarthrobacter nicotinovorans TaxID=29320 RepID=UPI00382FDAF8